MKYVTKRIEVDAVQFVDSDHPLPEGVERGEEARYAGGGSDQSFFRHKYGPIYNYYVETGHGRIQIRPGDWVLTMKDGTRYPYTQEDFGKCFDIVSEKDEIVSALSTLKGALEERGLNCKIADHHPFEILNSIGGLLGLHPGFEPNKVAQKR